MVDRYPTWVPWYCSGNGDGDGIWKKATGNGICNVCILYKKVQDRIEYSDVSDTLVLRVKENPSLDLFLHTRRLADPCVHKS